MRKLSISIVSSLLIIIIMIILIFIFKKFGPVEIVKVEPEVQTIKQDPVVKERYERPKKKKIRKLEIRIV